VTQRGNRHFVDSASTLSLAGGIALFSVTRTSFFCLHTLPMAARDSPARSVRWYRYGIHISATSHLELFVRRAVAPEAGGTYRCGAYRATGAS